MDELSPFGIEWQWWDDPSLSIAPLEERRDDPEADGRHREAPQSGDDAPSLRPEIPRFGRLKMMAASAGYRLLSIGGLHISTLRLLCGNNHRFDVEYSPTMFVDHPLEGDDGSSRRDDGVKSLCAACNRRDEAGCPPPESFKVESRDAQLKAFCREHVLCKPADYTNSYLPCTWTCAKGHQFKSSKSALNSRLRRSMDRACPQCRVDEAGVLGTTCLVQPADLAFTSLCKWRCQCGDVFLRSLKEGKIVCPKCRVSLPS